MDYDSYDYRDGRGAAPVAPGPRPRMMGPPLPGPGMLSAPGVPPRPVLPPIDREKTCPLLMRVFPKQGGHHHLEEYAKKQLPPENICIYTWMDATLKEISELIKEVVPAARGKTARLSFAFVYPDRKGRNVMRQVGSVHASRPGGDDNKSLRELNFQTGDYMDVAIY